MIAEGDIAPDFTLPDDTGENVTLSSLRGKPVVLYFYPKDNTSGCTTQACGMRDAWADLSAPAPSCSASHPTASPRTRAFKENYDLPFTLLADTEHAVAEAYGVWAQKSRYGRTYMGIVRSTFVIDAGGTVLKAMPNVQPATHAADVLAVLVAGSGLPDRPYSASSTTASPRASQ